MHESRGVEAESPAVQAHLAIVQSIIERMAANSAACKAWCIALVSAVLVIVADKGKQDYVLIAFIPTILFLGLDAYYLALERGFRDAYNCFNKKLHEGRVQIEDLYWILPKGPLFRGWLGALFSFSIWPFYITLFLMIMLTRRVVAG